MMKKVLYLLLIFLYTADLLAEEKYNFFGVLIEECTIRQIEEKNKS